jgi:hypothetical protein
MAIPLSPLNEAIHKQTAKEIVRVYSEDELAGVPTA